MLNWLTFGQIWIISNDDYGKIRELQIVEKLAYLGSETYTSAIGPVSL